MKDDRKLITLQEVAKSLGTTRQTVSNWCSHGVFKTRKIGKCVYIDKDTLELVRDSLEDVLATKASVEEMKRVLVELKDSLRLQQIEIKAALCIADKFGHPNKLGGIVKPLCKLAYSENDSLGVKKGYRILQMLAEGRTLQSIAEKDMHRSIAALCFDAAKALKKLSKLETYPNIVRVNELLKERVKSLESKYSNVFDENICLNAIIQNEVSGEWSQKFASAKDLNVYKLLKNPVSSLHLSVRASNALRTGEVETIGDLVQFRENELVRFRNMGRRSVGEIIDKLLSLGLNLGMELHPLIERVNNTIRYESLKSNGTNRGIQPTESVAVGEGCEEGDTSERSLRADM